jgi:hypothetical protein
MNFSYWTGAHKMRPYRIGQCEASQQLIANSQKLHLANSQKLIAKSRISANSQ